MSRNRRGRPINTPPGFIHPCRPIVAKRPPVGPGWVHELKHDGYRLQIHVRDGRVRLFTMNGNNWTDRYPRIVEEAGPRQPAFQEPVMKSRFFRDRSLDLGETTAHFLGRTHFYA